MPQARAIAEASLIEAPFDVTLKDPASDWIEAFAAKTIKAHPLFARTLRLDGVRGDPTRLPGFAEGAWWVQDAAGALVAGLLPESPDRPAVDLCAAPGGKTLVLAARGQTVIAVDTAQDRLARLRENLKRVRLSAEVVAADATQWHPPTAPRTLLLDAPCSGSGTLRRHPDIAHLRREEELAALTDLQDRLLDQASHILAPNGVMVYAVCSLLPDEGCERIEALLQRRSDLTRLPIDPAELGNHAELRTAAGDMLSLPCHLADVGGLDGFFACRLKKAP